MATSAKTKVQFEPVIGLEVHAELHTRSKMFCACPVVDTTQAQPNTAVCPVCAGMPGTLPVLNQKAVEFALRVALALECEIASVSIFARKNYFYPDLPKGYQISQYEQPLARSGRLTILTSQGEKVVRIRRVHLEEDTGKLTHVEPVGATPGVAQGRDKPAPYSLVDLNRAGVPLLEIVTEPDFHNAEEVRAYAAALRSLLRCLGVNTGDMQKGVLRIEPNLSLRPVGSQALGTKVEIKNLNSFRALERAVAYEIERQTKILASGGTIRQETLGWDDVKEVTYTQRVKEGEDDYRYFPEPDLPPLVVDEAWIAQARAALPELPYVRFLRFQRQYALGAYAAALLTEEKAIADYFEQAANQQSQVLTPKLIANWMTGELFALMNQTGVEIETIRLSPAALAELAAMTAGGEINPSTAKTVLAEMFATGRGAAEIVAAQGLQQVSDADAIAPLVRQTLAENPHEVANYLGGKATVANWLFGQVMKKAGGRANPQVVRQELERQLDEARK